MKRAFSTLCCLDYSIPEIATLAEEYDMDAVELRVDDRMLASFGDVIEARRQFESRGICVSDVATSIFVRDDSLSPLAEDYVSLAEGLEASAVRVFAASDFEGKLDLELISEGLCKLCRVAGDHGIDVWLETHSELSTGSVCRRVLDLARDPRLYILWDVMHSLEHGEALEETYALVGERIAHVHLKDGVKAVSRTEYELCGLGEGAFPFDGVISLLKNNNYNGCLSLEWESPWCPHLKNVYKNERELLEKYNEILNKAGVDR